MAETRTHLVALYWRSRCLTERTDLDPNGSGHSEMTPWKKPAISRLSISSFQISYVLLESTKIYSTQNPHIYLRQSYKHRNTGNTSIAFCQLPVSCPIFRNFHRLMSSGSATTLLRTMMGFLWRPPCLVLHQFKLPMRWLKDVKSTASQSNVLQDPRKTTSFWYLRCLFGFRGNQKHMNDILSCVRTSYSIIWLDVRVPEGPQNWSCRLLVCWQVPFQSALKKE